MNYAPLDIINQNPKPATIQNSQTTNQTSNNNENDDAFEFGFKRLLNKIENLKKQANDEAIQNNENSNVNSDELLLTAEDLRAINPELFANIALAKNGHLKSLSEVNIPDNFNAMFAKIRQIVIKLGLQNVTTEGALKTIDLHKIDLSKLNLDEFQLLKKIALSDIAAFLPTNKVIGKDGKIIKLDNAKIEKNKNIESDAHAITTADRILAALQVMQKLTVSTVEVAGNKPETVLFFDGQPIVKLQPEQSEKNVQNVIPGTTPILPTQLTYAGSIDDNTVAPLQSFALKNIISAILMPTANAQKLINAVRLTPAATTIASHDKNLFGGESTHLTDFGLVDALSSTGNMSAGSSTVDTATQVSNVKIAQNGAAHVATDQIQVHIQKMAARADKPGESNLTIHLDPAELGRVKIKLSFQEDGVVKARLTMERPETMALLQRDQNILLRNLENIGITLSSDGGLSFDLSQGQSFAGQFGNTNSGNPQNETGNENVDQSEDDVELVTDLITTVAIDDGRVNIKV